MLLQLLVCLLLPVVDGLVVIQLLQIWKYSNFIVICFCFIISNYILSLVSGVWRNISVLLALVIGAVVASFYGYTDFSHIGKADWLGLVTPLHFGVPTFDIPAIIVMILVILVVMTRELLR